MATEIEIDGICDEHEPDSKFCPIGQQHNDIFWHTKDNSNYNTSDFLTPVMNLEAKKPLETLLHVNHILWTILPTLCFFAIARILTQNLHLNDAYRGKRFVLEFVTIVVPITVSVNVANGIVVFIVLLFTAYILFLMQWKKCISQARTRYFDLGNQLPMLTLARAHINILTALCILAIDFASFPKVFRKSRRYGAGLMDVGIGLFIFAMGSVSRRPSCTTDLRKLFKVVAPILVLALARTIIIRCIDYNQDEHEYGRHLNAFFTLGITKLIGTLLSGVAITDVQLMSLGLGILGIHESILQLGVSNFVMDSDIKRNTFLTANREGICSLPGFVAIYLISMYIGRLLHTNTCLSYNEFVEKVRTLAKVSGVFWVLVLFCIFSLGIARVTCNFGYACWVLATAATITTLYMLVFELVLNTVWPVGTWVPSTDIMADEESEERHLKPHALNHITKSCSASLPSLVEAINRNGLIFFLLANVLTGGVNIFLKPEDRSEFESIVILCCYMLITTGFVYILYIFKVRIA